MTQDKEITSNTLDAKFSRYAFKKHILLEGDKGSGKTHYASRWTTTFPITKIFIGGHEQFESIDFLGHFMQSSSGVLLWKDGALSQAFRSAKSGQKVLLIIDEMLRIPKRELNLLVSALSPISGHYVLRTGRALKEENGIAIEEVLAIPSSHLWVIGTTNVGSDYAIDTIDEALIDRFKPIRKETTIKEIEQILRAEATKKGFALIEVQKLLTFYTKMQHFRKINILHHKVNLRHLKEALEFASCEQEIKIIIEDSILLWVDREKDGNPDQEQMTTIHSILKKVWKP